MTPSDFNQTMLNPFHIEDLGAGLTGSSREAEFLRGLEGSYRDLYASVLSIVGSRADADDVVQEVCAVLWEKFDEFEPGTSFRKWSCAFAFNVAKAHLRQRRRRKGFGLSDQALLKISQHQNAGTELFDLRREILERCLTKLPAKDHRFIMECYSRRTTLGQYARNHNTPITTVYTRLHRLRKVIVDCVQRGLSHEEP